MESLNFNRFSENSQLNGKITLSGDCYLAGTVKGELHIDQQGLLLIEPTGVVEGIISGHDIQILGQITGEIYATGKVIVKSSGKIFGKIQARSITISPGAVIESNLDIQL